MSDEILDRIAAWCGDEPDIEFGEGRVVLEGDPPLHIDLALDDDRVLLSHSHRNPDPDDEFADAARRLLTRRGSMVRGTVEAGTDGITTTVEYPIYREGINRQNFLLAVRDIAGTVDALGEASASAAAPAAAVPEEPSPAFQPVEAGPSTEELTAPVSQVVGAQDQPWAPTHVVPGGGMDAWSEPDPSQAPATTLQARVELRVDEMRGAWAHVTGSNGWTGWVDGRRLVAAGGSAGRTGTVAAGGASPGFGVMRAGNLSIRLLPLLGGLALIISAFLPWESFSQLGLDVKPFDLPLAVLWGEGTPTQPELGLALLIVGALAAALAVIPRAPRPALLTAGIVGAACAVLFFIQLSRVADWNMGDVFDVLGIGVWITLAGGILVAVDKGT